jgi:hypothetical protein
MNAALISAVLATVAVGAASTQQSEATSAAARAALLAPQGYSVTVSCPQRIFPAFGVKVTERNGRLVARFPSCERALQEPEAGVFHGEYCNSQPFQWVYQPGDAQSPFKGSGGRFCSVALARK